MSTLQEIVDDWRQRMAAVAWEPRFNGYESGRQVVDLRAVLACVEALAYVAYQTGREASQQHPGVNLFTESLAAGCLCRWDTDRNIIRRNPNCPVHTI